MSKNKQKPYQSPQRADPGKPSGLRTALATGLAIFTVPAAGIAFFLTCAANTNFHDGAAFDIWPWVWGAMAGAAVAVPMIFFVLQLRR